MGYGAFMELKTPPIRHLLAKANMYRVFLLTQACIYAEDPRSCDVRRQERSA